jgi:hypothetical protein
VHHSYVDLAIYDTLASRRAREPLAADCMHALGSESLDAHGGNASAPMLFRTQGVHGSTGLVAQAVTNLADGHASLCGFEPLPLLFVWWSADR